MRELNDALYLLLHDARYRKAFLDGDHARLGLAAQDEAALRTIDAEELVKTSEQILSNVLKGDFDVGGGLRRSYPAIFEALRQEGQLERSVMYEFLSSDAFLEYREIPFAGEGICVEEAFYLFLRDHPSFLKGFAANAMLLRHEFLTVMLSILTVNRDPHFSLRSTDLIRTNGALRYAVQTYPRPIVEALLGHAAAGSGAEIHYLYAASLRDTFVSGPIDEVAIALVESGSDGRSGPPSAQGFVVASLALSQYSALSAKLVDLGLLTPK